jgi:hypothetical protein
LEGHRGFEFLKREPLLLLHGFSIGSLRVERQSFLDSLVFLSLEEGKQCSENLLVSCRKLVALHLHKERKKPDTPREMFC